MASVASAIFVIASLVTPQVALADEVYFRLVDVEIKYLGLWEEPAWRSTPGQTPNTADVFVDVEVKNLKTMKIGVYDQISNTWLATTVYSATSYGHKIWTPTITVPTAASSLGVYVYYWNATLGQYVQDDVAFGWTPVHHPTIRPTPTWGPNQYSLPTNSRVGDFATYQQYIWYWDNSHYVNQDVGTLHRSRLNS